MEKLPFFEAIEEVKRGISDPFTRIIKIIISLNY
jgi:hypothetical protein